MENRKQENSGMQRGFLYSEHIATEDPTTGVRIIQLISYPTPSVHFNYDWPSVTPDNKRLVLLCQRWTERTAPWDLFRCDTDGWNLYQLTKKEGVNSRPTTVLSLDGKTIYALWPEEGILCSVDVETGDIDDLCDLGMFKKEGYVCGNILVAGMCSHIYIGMRSYEFSGGAVIRVDMKSGRADLFSDDMTIYGCDQTKNRLVVIKNFMKLGIVQKSDGTRGFANINPEPMTLWSINESGGDDKYISTVDMFGHSTMLGRTSKIQGTDQRNANCIWIAEAEKQPYKLVEGHHFWHAGASFDGEWIISDTNWPDEGIKLIHVPTRHFRTLCYAKASQGYAQASHCHPALSHDGRIAVFTSDRTGISQVYVAQITDEFRKSVINGEREKK